MDDHILPLDLTIYGTIHQHEMRKKAGAMPLNMMWQGLHNQIQEGFRARTRP
jgi:E3 ubiquitin-protein ligase TRIP12